MTDDMIPIDDWRVDDFRRLCAMADNFNKAGCNEPLHIQAVEINAVLAVLIKGGGLAAGLWHEAHAAGRRDGKPDNAPNTKESDENFDKRGAQAYFGAGSIFLDFIAGLFPPRSFAYDVARALSMEADSDANGMQPAMRSSLPTPKAGDESDEDLMFTRSVLIAVAIYEGAKVGKNWHNIFKDNFYLASDNSINTWREQAERYISKKLRIDKGGLEFVRQAGKARKDIGDVGAIDDQFLAALERVILGYRSDAPGYAERLRRLQAGQKLYRPPVQQSVSG